MNTGDLTWLLVSSALVLFMTPGLALFYAGMVRSKNVLATMMQSFWCMSIVTMLWVTIGYTLAFGTNRYAGGLIGGLDHLFLAHMKTAEPGFETNFTNDNVYMLYQMMFAVITPALITGAFAERMSFKAFFAFTVIWSVLVYSPIAHWVWSPDGWLFKLGALDFAGGTVVHISAGIAALMAAIVLGKRLGWPKEQHVPHNLTMTLLGAGILWFGWFGFNGGSALAANGVAAHAFINTHVAAACAAFSWVIVEWVKDGHPTTLGVASGAVAGLVGITPAAGFVGLQGAMAIGLIAGVVCYYAIQLKHRLRYDDALDVVGVHMVGGIVGALLTGVFAIKAINPAGADGLLAGNPALLGKQAIGVLATLVFSGLVSWVLLVVIDKLIGLRVRADDEIAGLDISEHSEVGYSLMDLGSTTTSFDLAGLGHSSSAPGTSTATVSASVPSKGREAQADSRRRTRSGDGPGGPKDGSAGS